MKFILTLLPILALLALAAGIYTESRKDRELPPLNVLRPEERAFTPLQESASDELTGVVLGKSGAPLVEALIYLQASGEPHWTSSEANGRFTLKDPGPAPWTITVVAHDHLPQKFAVESGPAELRLRAELEPIPRLEPIRRRDLAGNLGFGDPEDQGPRNPAAAGYEIFFDPLQAPDEFGGAVPRRARVGADGRFELPRLALGEYRVAVLPDWARGSRWPDLSAAGERSYLHQEGSGSRNLTLHLAGGRIRGRVVDGAGAPLEGAMITIVPVADESRLWPPTVTDAEGAFHVPDLTPDTYLVLARAGASQLRREVRVAAQEEVSIEFEVPTER